MRAIGIDIWVEKEELRKKKFHPHNGIEEIISQEKLRKQLTELVEKLQHEGWKVIDCCDDRVRVLADDEKVNSLYKLIVAMLPGSDLLAQIGNSLEYQVVPEDTPINQRPRWDENRWCEIKDFSQFHPAEDELLVLVRHWTKEILGFHWDREMNGFAIGRSDICRYLDRPEVRIARIEKLIGADLTEKAVEEAEKAFEKEIDDPVAYEIFKHGDHRDKELFYNSRHSAYDRKYRERDDIVRKFIDEQSLDEKRALLLRELARFDASRNLSEVLTSLSNHYREQNYHPLNENKQDSAP
jgi:hypothetical protein